MEFDGGVGCYGSMAQLLRGEQWFVGKQGECKFVAEKQSDS